MGTSLLAPVVVFVAVMLVGGVAGCLIARTRAREARRSVRIRLIPGRTDEATPARVQRLMEVLHQLLLRRWWQRILGGQPGVGLELCVRNGRGGPEAEISIVLPEEPALLQAVRGRLLATHRDVLLTPGDPLPAELAAVVRLKKRHAFITRLRIPEEYGEPLVDAALSTMAALEQPVVVQYALVPTPALFDRVARARFKRVEIERERARLRETGDPGIRSEFVESELEGALHSQHRPLFFCDIRVAAETEAGARLTARALRGESAQENRLVERTMRNPGRLGLYLDRLQDARANPIPGFLRGVVSSAELAGLWHLPSPFLDAVRVQRNPIPRVPAPPSILRVSDPARALACDGDGHLCLRDADKYANLALLGRPGGGKTSVMLRSALADAADRNCALIVLDPKGELADATLGLLPDDGKPVHVINLADCEAGIDPFRIPGGSPQAIAAGIVAAMKAVTEDSQGAHQIGFSSDRYIRQGAIAIAAAEPEPDMWKLWRLLNASEDAYRAQVAAKLVGREGLEQTQLFLGQELPYQLQRSPANFITRLDAPMNKAIRTTTGALDVCFRHPYKVDVDQVIERREVLIVNGCAGDVETDDVAVVMQFALVFIHNALLRQQRLPKSERARVALKVDEAHLGIFSHKFAELLALGRSSGLECVCAFQSPSQIADRVLRSEIFDLLQNWCVFACGEDAARELSALIQTVYSDVQRDDAHARERQRITTDALINLPRYYFAASWLAEGARTLPFVAQTLEMEPPDPALSELHLERQRQRGGHPMTPESLPVAYASIGKQADGGLADEPAMRNGNEGRSSGVEDEPTAAHPADVLKGEGATRTSEDSPPLEAEAPVASSEERHRPDHAEETATPPSTPASDGAQDCPAGAPPAPAAPAVPPRVESTPPPDSRASKAPTRKRTVAKPATIPGEEIATLSELDLYARPRGLKWDVIDPVPKVQEREPTLRELAILAALSELRVLSGPQIHRRFMPGMSDRSLRDQLHQMCAQGWLRRCHVLCEGSGQTPRVFALTQAGWEHAKQCFTRYRPFVVSKEPWHEPQLTEDRRIVHDLHVNAWYFAFELIAGKVIAAVRGPRSCRLFPPSRPHPDYRHDATKRLALSPQEIAERSLGTGQRFDGIDPEAVAPIYPDLSIEVSLPKLPRRPRQHYLIEVERSRHPAGLKTKLARYDALIAAWARTQEPFLSTGLPPAVIFVCPDEPYALAAAKIADGLVRGRIASLEDKSGAWPYPGRKRMFFVAERDIHLRSLRAVMLNPTATSNRRAGVGHAMQLSVRDIIRREVLDDHL